MDCTMKEKKTVKNLSELVNCSRSMSNKITSFPSICPLYSVWALEYGEREKMVI